MNGQTVRGIYFIQDVVENRMSKIAIISQPDQGVLIDVSGCTTMQEAIEHLSSTLQVSSQFWKGTTISLNLGGLELASMQVAQILAITKGVGALPKQVFANAEITRQSLLQHNVRLGTGDPMRPLDGQLEKAVWHDVEEDEYFEKGEPVIEENPFAFETQDEQGLAAELEEHLPQPTVASGTATQPERPPLPAVLYLRQTLRSGQTVSHKGHLVIIGDVNPGAEVMAEQDITVWGALRGVAHAGIGGNIEAEIRALKLQPIQIRIAHAIARSPDHPRVKWRSLRGGVPETARLIDGKIRISRSNTE